MLRSLQSLAGYSVAAEDGAMGKIHNFLFDDHAWIVRYFVIETGSWLRSRRVLISPVAAGPPDWSRGTIPVSLTREQVRDSPDVDTDKPLSRQYEVALSQHYKWPHYWTAEMIFATPPPPVEILEPEVRLEGDPHLRSAREVIGYELDAIDGSVGQVGDFVVDDENWAITHVVAQIGKRSVLISPRRIIEVSWPEMRVTARLARAVIENCPEYDPAASVNRKEEIRFYDYHGRPTGRGPEAT
jgi:sporulation protein YlmC with PRC-barrel domain